MRRPRREWDGKISRLDRFQIVSSFLFVICGLVIVVRCLLLGLLVPPALLAGACLVGLGGYRLKLIRDSLLRRRS